MFASSADIKQRRRTCFGVVVGLTISFMLLMSWGRYDFCSGWALHYEKRALQLHTDASNPALPSNEIYEHLIVSKWSEIIARKYWRAAYQPWPLGSYPKAPLISQQDQLAVLERLASNGQIPRDVAEELLTELLNSK